MSFPRLPGGLFGILIPALLLCLCGCEPYASDDGIAVSRTIPTSAVATGGTVTVAVEIRNTGSDAIRGFYHAEHLPSAIEVTDWTVTIGGAAVSGILKETSASGEVISGRTTHRWVFEVPPDNAENHPIPAGATARIEYTLRTSTAGRYDVSWGNWVGARASGQALFGCWETREVLVFQTAGGADPFRPDVIPAFANATTATPVAFSETFRIWTADPRPARTRIDLSAGTFTLSGAPIGGASGSVSGTVSIAHSRLGGASGAVAGEVRWTSLSGSVLTGECTITSLGASLVAFLQGLGIPDPTGAAAFGVTITARAADAGGTIDLEPASLFASGPAHPANAILTLALPEDLFVHRTSPGAVQVTTTYTFLDARTASKASSFDVFWLGEGFVRGDANGDGLLLMDDSVYTLNFLFSTGPLSSCMDACDVNDDGMLSISDPVAILLYLFSEGSPPPPPFSECGSDPTDDALGCVAYTCP
ncbi:MAG: hypothetical protein JXP34_27710 [Planctomycetes bacterium]|nr:hypothetical protein [Planctomycetota bacterium]